MYADARILATNGRITSSEVAESYAALLAEVDGVSAALQERDAEIGKLKSIAYSDDGAGGEGMKLFLQVRAQRRVLEQAKEALKSGPSILHTYPDKANCKCSQCQFINLRTVVITAIQGVLK